MGTFHGQLPDLPTFQREAGLRLYITLKIGCLGVL